MYNLPVLKQLILLLHWVLVTIHDFLSSHGLGENWTWGLAIIGLTIIVRLILFPLTWKQYSSAQALQAMQPHVKELQRKHKDDRNKLQQETMKLYQEHRVNPLASCLPLLLQLPVFITLYAAIKGLGPLDKGNPPWLPTVDALNNATFLWIPHLGMPDPTYVLLILYVATQLISTELMLVTQTDKMQKMLMRAMPIMFVFFLWSFPAGLFVYWVTTNLWTIGQQLLIKKVMKPFAPPPAGAKPAKRSRIVDALVSAQGQSDKTPREDRAASNSPANKQKQGAKGQKQGKTSRKPSGAAGTKPAAEAAKPGDESPGSSGARQPGDGRPTAKRGSRKPPPGKSKNLPAASPADTAGPETGKNVPADG